MIYRTNTVIIYILICYILKVMVQITYKCGEEKSWFVYVWSHFKELQLI